MCVCVCACGLYEPQESHLHVQVPGTPGVWLKQSWPRDVKHKKVTAVQLQYLPRTGSTHAIDNGAAKDKQHGVTHGVQSSDGRHFTVVVDINRSSLQVSALRLHKSTLLSSAFLCPALLFSPLLCLPPLASFCSTRESNRAQSMSLSPFLRSNACSGLGVGVASTWKACATLRPLA